MSKKIITISLDSKINDKLENDKINKSKLVNFLIDNFFTCKNKKNLQENIKKFQRKP